MSGKLIYISYLFPPVCNGGVPRPLQQSKYLRRLGWDVVVITGSRYRGDTSYDDGLYAQIETGIRVVRDGPDPHQQMPPLIKACGQKQLPVVIIKRMKQFVGRLAFDTLHVLPDREAIWAIRMMKMILFSKSLRKELHTANVIYASIMPFSSALLAFILSLWFSKPFVVEYRDLFVGNPNFRSPLLPSKKIIDLAYEWLIVRHASKIVVVTPTMANYFSARYGAKDKIEVIPNGYDVDPGEIHSTRARNNERPYLLRYTGRLYERQDASHLANALEKLAKRGAISTETFRLEFFGPSLTLTQERIFSWCLAAGLIEHRGFASHQECLALQADSDALLLIEQEMGVYTTKVFEYLVHRKPILALLTYGSDLHRLLSEIGHTNCVYWADTNGIVKVVSKLAQREYSRRMTNLDEQVIDSYHRSQLVSKLSTAIEEVCSGNDPTDTPCA